MHFPSEKFCGLSREKKTVVYTIHKAAYQVMACPLGGGNTTPTPSNIIIIIIMIIAIQSNMCLYYLFYMILVARGMERRQYERVLVT